MSPEAAVAVDRSAYVGAGSAISGRQTWRGMLVRVAWSTGVFLAAVLVWEGYRVGGQAAGISWPFRVNDRTLPHLTDIGGQFFEPSRRNGPLLIETLLKAAWFTAREAAAGFLLGASAGFGLGVAFDQWRWLQRGFLPYVVVSQTIPILALAPMVVIWMGSGWWSVAIIAAYLTFFPVTINTLRGLRAADPRAHELMESYAARRLDVLLHLKIPASLPYVFTALKATAAFSVVGAIIGELPSSIQDGLGGAILNFNQYYLSSPPSLWAVNLVAALLGIGFFVAVALVERAVTVRAPERRA